METEGALHETEEQDSDGEVNVTSSVESPQGSSSSDITVLDSDEQDEGEGRPQGGTEELVQRHENEPVIDPQGRGYSVEVDDDVNSEDFQEPAAKRKKRDTPNSRGSATHEEEGKLNISTDDVSWHVCRGKHTYSGQP